MFAPGVPAVMKDFHSTSDLIATFVVSIYLLGFAFGPLIVAPLSEMYGRWIIYTVCNVFFVIFAVACALATNMGMLVAFRFLHGVAGVAPLTIGGGTIADLMPVEKRGGAMAIYAIGPLIGPVCGPVAAGYLVEATTWRWVFWLLAIISGICCVLAFFLLKETYAPKILADKTKRLRKETGNQNLKSRLEPKIGGSKLLWLSITRPTKMLLFSPIITVICLYTAIAYGILYMLFTTFSFVFGEQYGFSPGAVGLTYIPLGVGMMLSLVIMGSLSDRGIKKKQAAGKTIVPEDRIPLHLIIPGAVCLPAGLFLYGWTVQYKIHWIVPLIGTGIMGFGLFILFVSRQSHHSRPIVSDANLDVLANLLGGCFHHVRRFRSRSQHCS
jgi:multidrug resistance protein